MQEDAAGDSAPALDEESIDSVSAVLQDQHQGLVHLTDYVQKDMRDADLCLSLVGGGGADSAGGGAGVTYMQL
jgi:hypothetical protein